MTVFKNQLSVQLVKYLTTFFSLSFSLNILAANDTLYCKNDDTVQKYHRLLEEKSNTDSDMDLVYKLAFVSLCIGKTEEGINYLQTAADANHIAALNLLSIYYGRNRTFDSSEARGYRPEDLNEAYFENQNWNKSIQLLDKAAEIIESTPNYPEGSTSGIMYDYIPISSHIFQHLPRIHFHRYTKLLRYITHHNKKKLPYNTLDTLSKIREASSRCLHRLAFYSFRDNFDKEKISIKEPQQIRCNFYLDFATITHLLEKYRIQEAEKCTVPLSECTEHQEIVTAIRILIKRTMHVSDEMVHLFLFNLQLSED